MEILRAPNRAVTAPTFEACGDLVLELLGELNVGKRYVYLHDLGAPVGLHVAMKRPEALLGVVIQNANANKAFEHWAQPGHLSRQGARDTYLAGLPADLAERVDPLRWKDDRRVMRLPGRLASQRALLRDYSRYAERSELIVRFIQRNGRNGT